MSKVKAGPVSGDRVKSFIERVEKLLEERYAIQSDIRDVFSEAKGVGYDVKTLRKLIQIRAMDAAERDEANTLLDTYAHAIGAEEIVGTFAREPSEEELIDRASKIVREVDRCMLLPRDPLPTIRAIMDAIKCSSGKAHKLRKLVEERIDAMEEFSQSNPASVKNENEIDSRPKAPEASSTVPARATDASEEITEKLKPGGDFDASRDCLRITPSKEVSRDAGHLVPEPEVARVAPPVTDPDDPWAEVDRAKAELDRMKRERVEA